MQVPPPYTPFYCEENIWHLCQRGFDRACSLWVAFISNEGQRVALWNQRAGPPDGGPIVWDYHVVLIVEDASGVEVWDLDTVLGFPISATKWWSGTFPFFERVPAQWEPSFRLIEATTYRETFSSDRSHMRTHDEEWIQPPPAWPAIRPRPESNLSAFVDMNSTAAPGQVVDGKEWCERFLR